MKHAWRFGLLGLVATLACDDAHKVGDDVGVAGRAAAGGKQGSLAGQTSLGGTNAIGGAFNQSGAGASGGATSAGNAGAMSNGGNAAIGGSPLTGDGGSIVGGATAGGSAGSAAAGQAGSVVGGTTAGGSAGAAAAGQAGAAGSAPFDEVCTWGTTQFEFTVDDPSAYCQQWYPFFPVAEIYDAAGNNLVYLNKTMPSGFYRSRCPDCRGRAVPTIYDSQGQMRESVYTESWAGNIEEIRSCSSDPWEECGVRHCAPAGRYVARFCVAPKGNATTCLLDSPNLTDLFPRTACVEVPFDFPTSEVVRGRLSTPTVGAAGASGVGGAGGAAGSSGSAGSAGSAGTAACLPGCTFAGIASWCPAEAKHSWRCEIGMMQAWSPAITAECKNASILPAGAYCCSPSFQTQCQSP